MDLQAIIDAILSAAQQMTVTEALAVFFSLAYVFLAARENILCWPSALIASVLAIYTCITAKLLAESVLHSYYFIMAIYGWYQWTHGSKGNGRELPITQWPLKWHYLIAITGLLITAAFGYLFETRFEAALPYLDSFTTTFAIITTVMVANKVLENWLYWIIIDGVSVYLYGSRELYLFAALSIAYTIISIFGYIKWRKEYALQQ